MFVQYSGTIYNLGIKLQTSTEFCYLDAQFHVHTCTVIVPVGGALSWIVLVLCMFLSLLVQNPLSINAICTLHTVCLYALRCDNEESRAAVKNLVLLIQNLVFAGFLSLEPALSDPGPFQDRTFFIPIPSGDGKCMC